MADIGNRLNTFDTLTTGANIVSGDLPSGWGVTGTGGTLTVVAKTWTHGTKGAQFNNATTSRAFIESGSYGTGVACQTVYFILDSISATAIILSGGTGSANWRLNANRTVQARNNTSVVGSASGVIITADGTTVYRAEHSTNPGAGTQQFKVFAGDDNASPLYDSGSQTLVGTTRTNYQFGATAAAAGVVVTILAAWVADTAFTGPLLTSVTSTRATTWNVAAPLTSVTSSRATTWNVAAIFNFPVSYPVIAAHRGGSPNGEETLEAYAATLALIPNAALEYDLQDTASANLALSHDDTVDRTADASSPITTGSIGSLTATQWRSVIITPAAGGGVTGHGITDDDIAGVYGPSSPHLHLPEIKTGANATNAIARIKSNGIAPMSIVQSFSYSYVTQAVAAGLEVVYEMAGGDSHTFSQMKADGINHVMRNKTLWTTGDITSAKAAGLKTWIFTIDTLSEWNTWLGNGIDGGVISDTPWLLVATTSVTSSRATTWNTKASVSPSTRATTWNTRATVSPSTRATTWNVAAAVTATRATTWNVKASVSATRATTWNVSAVVAASTRATTWAVRTAATSTRATTWNTIAGVTASTRATTWNVRTAATSTRATTWNTIASATSTRATTWNVAGTLSSVSATRATTWNVKAAVTGTKATTWNVSTAATSSRSTTWNVRTATTAQRNTTWNVRAAVASSRAASWNVSAGVTSQRNTLWDVRAAITSARSTTWNVFLDVAGDGVPVVNPTAVITTTTPRAAITTQTRRGAITSAVPTASLIGV